MKDEKVVIHTPGMSPEEIARAYRDAKDSGKEVELDTTFVVEHDDGSRTFIRDNRVVEVAPGFFVIITEEW